MRKYEVQIRTYDCHPETCCHWEHLPYWVVKLTPWKEAGLHGYAQEWLEGFNTRKEAEEALKDY